jgi:hypothetical protein
MGIYHKVFGFSTDELQHLEGIVAKIQLDCLSRADDFFFYSCNQIRALCDIEVTQKDIEAIQSQVSKARVCLTRDNNILIWR